MKRGGQLVKLSSLPHRQLRKSNTSLEGEASSSLPHRQLRNEIRAEIRRVEGSLPHRQLRKFLTEVY